MQLRNRLQCSSGLLDPAKRSIDIGDREIGLYEVWGAADDLFEGVDGLLVPAQIAQHHANTV